MTNDSFHQRRPDRRFRRLLPAAVAAVTVASSAPFLAPTMARADTGARPQHREQLRAQPPGKIPAILRADTTRGIHLQDVSST
jgi:hypothetical protein